MIYLVLCVALSALLFTGFKWFDNKGLNLLMIITGNYISCIITGLVMNSFDRTKSITHPFDSQMIFICMALGIFFFAVFYAMGYGSAKIGVGITSASTKMSLVIPVTYGAVAFGEALWPHHIIALILALTAVILMSVNKGEKLSLKQLLLPFFIFIGSGIVDLSINLLRIELDERNLDHETSIILIFTGALCSALLILLTRKRYLLTYTRSLGHGLLLGVPNYFSIYVMMKALGSGEFSSNTFYMLNNTGVVVLCSLLGLALFEERITWAKGVGLVLSIISICYVLYS